MTKRSTIILVDDQLAVLDAMAARLEAAGFHVIETLDNARGIVGACQKTTPDLVALDVSAPGPSPFEAVPRIKGVSPKTKVVFLTGHASDQFVDNALRGGVDGYISKSEPFPAVVAALNKVLAGENYWSPNVADRVRKVQGQPPASRLSTLTPREREILRYLAGGMNCQDLARLLGLSRKTVEKHQYHLRDKLKIYSAGELTLFAIREGLIAP
jgi:DNA-binding NarL/FixJ family response regulator